MLLGSKNSGEKGQLPRMDLAHYKVVSLLAYTWQCEPMISAGLNFHKDLAILGCRTEFKSCFLFPAKCRKKIVKYINTDKHVWDSLH